MVADAFDNGARSGVANGKAFSGTTRGEEQPTGCAVEGYVAEESVGFALLSDAAATADDEFPAAEPFADEVVSQTFKGEGHSRRREGAEGLAGGAVEIEGDLRSRNRRIVGPILRDFAGEAGAKGAVLVGDTGVEREWHAGFVRGEGG